MLTDNIILNMNFDVKNNMHYYHP